MTKRKPISKRRKAIIIWLIIILLIALYAAGVKAYKVITVSQLRDIAYQFKPESNWVKTGEYSEEPNLTWLGCIDSTCPKYEIYWNTNQSITKEHFQSLIQQSGWAGNIEGTCVPKPQFGGRGIVCSTLIKVGNDTVEISYRADPENILPAQMSIKVTR